MIGAIVALPLSAPAAPEPLNLAATPMASQKLAPLQRLPLSALPRAQLRGPVQVNAQADELKFLPKESEELKVMAKDGRLQKIAQKIGGAAATAEILSHPAHAALSNNQVYTQLVFALVAGVMAVRLGTELYNFPP